MKRIFLYFSILFFIFCTTVCAQEEQTEFVLEDIVLENIESGFLLNVKPDDRLERLLKERTIEYLPNELAGYNSIFSTTSGLYFEDIFEIDNKRKFNNFALGIKYNNKASIEGFEQARTFYYEYEKEKWFIKLSYKTDSFGLYKKKNNISFSVAPEYKLTNNLSLKYSYTEKYNKKNSDVIFVVRPFKSDDITFDFGAGQIYYNDNKPPSSQILFSTEFNF